MTVRETGPGKRDDGGSSDGVERVTSRAVRPITPSHRPQLDGDVRERRHVNSSTDNCGRHTVQQRHTLGRQRVSSPVRQLRLTLELTGSRPYTSSDSHSDNVVDDYWVTLVHPLSSASGAQSYLHCVSVTRPSHSLLTQNVLRRCSQLSIL